MKPTHIRRALVAALLVMLSATSAQAADLSISQFRVRGPAGGNDEFVELFNSGTKALDLSGYKFNASNASGTTGTRLTLPSGTSIASGCFLLLTNGASGGYSGNVAGDVKYSTGVTDDGGLAILDANGQLIDQVGLSSGSAYKAGTPLASLGGTNADKGYARSTDASGLPVNTGNNQADFVVASPTAPRSSTSPCAVLGQAFSIADASVKVRSAADVPMPFTVTLTQPAPTGGVTVQATTRDLTAVAANGDYDALDTTVNIAEGQTQASFNVVVHGRSTPADDKAFEVKLSNPSGNLPLARDTAMGAILYDIPVAAEIWEIQGRGQVSPLVGKSVITRGNIVTAVGPAGFTMQTPDARADADPLTSNGIYVFTSTQPSVAVGDVVNVDATVDNYYNLPELKNAVISVTAHGSRLPAPVVFGDKVPSSDPDTLSCGTTNFQCFVGMRVVIENGMINTGNKRFSTEPYAEVSITANGKRSLRLPGVRYGTQVAEGVTLPHWSGNPEVFKMNTADFGAVPLNTPFVAGTTFRAEGVISYDFGAYTFIPTSIKLKHVAEMPRAVSPTAPYALRVGALNTERFCDTDFNTVYTCSGDSKEPTATDVALKTQRLSAYIGSVLQLPDVLSVEEVKSLPLLQGLATQLGDDYRVKYNAYLLPGHDPSGINVGFLVRSDRVHVVSVQQLAADESWNDNGQTAFVHDHPPLLITAEARGVRFQVISVHTKARTNVDKDDATAVRDRQKRFLQASSLARQVQTLQTTNPWQPLLIVGDFNAYQFSDGWVDMVGLISGKYKDSENQLKLGKNLVFPALWNAVESVPANDRYSFLFTEKFGPIQGYTVAGSGNSGREVPTVQVLDHALLNQSARLRFLKMQYGRADLDAPVQMAADAATATDSRKAIGVSDHDGFVVDLFVPGKLGEQKPHGSEDQQGEDHDDQGHGRGH
ncbi:lamin tail domain-containing protein [Dyella telluris]|uniref:Lamin tail domain-containing protein n=1 Tax=Dyella telluris TaxID=2763498 RepID=A0A7G8Q0X3_9GAMM|nr:lamin tail domain-containing protein [Dyella telluris]QNK00431.1 lamin tail domain-containing protein [Dyella telluris]